MSRSEDEMKTFYKGNRHQEWSTPQEIYDRLNAEFCFTLDPCATPENAKCDRFYTKEDNGLVKSWPGTAAFMNPPYGREITKWVSKAAYESRWQIVVGLLPARTDTQWFHNHIYRKAEIRFLKGRLKFSDAGPAPFPSMVVIWTPQEVF